MVKDTFCSYCGHEYQGAIWPRVCGSCNSTVWRNPIPVAIAMVRMDDGILIIRRNIDPQRGKLALPGGFIDFGEDWRVACSRELMEETGLNVHWGWFRPFTVKSAPTTTLVFGLADIPPIPSRRIADFKPNDEVQECLVVSHKEFGAKMREQFAFPTHLETMTELFNVGGGIYGRP